MVDEQEFTDDQGIGLESLIGALKRHKKWASVIAAVVFVVGVVAIFSWPTKYQSTATILLEEPEVPKDLVRTTVTVLPRHRFSTSTNGL